MKIKFGLGIPSLKKRIASRLSVKRYIRHTMGLKAPRGWGWITIRAAPSTTASTDAPPSAIWVVSIDHDFGDVTRGILVGMIGGIMQYHTLSRAMIYTTYLSHLTC